MHIETFTIERRMRRFFLLNVDLHFQGTKLQLLVFLQTVIASAEIAPHNFYASYGQ